MSAEILQVTFHHCSLIVADTEKALRFYCGILGLQVDENRPEMAYRGAWLQLGEAAGGGQIHLLELPNPDPVSGRPEHGGRDRHLALGVSDLELITARLAQAGIGYTLSKSGREALFCRDYDGNAIELIAVRPDDAGASSKGVSGQF